MIKIPNKSLIAYLTYPYSNDPKGNTKKARELTCKIMKKYPNIFIIVPHTAVDNTLFGDFIERKEKHANEDHINAILCEFIILEKIDIFILGTKKEDMSTGMCWEYSYVLHLNQIRKKQILIIELEEVLNNG